MSIVLWIKMHVFSDVRNALKLKSSPHDWVASEITDYPLCVEGIVITSNSRDIGCFERAPTRCPHTQGIITGTDK